MNEQPKKKTYVREGIISLNLFIALIYISK